MNELHEPARCMRSCAQNFLRVSLFPPWLGMSSIEVAERDDYSTFFQECKELAFVLQNGRERALILVS
jgi:hypothetical protein